MPDKLKINALLMEWELCQHNAAHYRNWAWQTGSIFIALSSAALWITTQIKPVIARFYYTKILFVLSVGTILIWWFFIVRRSVHISKICYERAHEIEKKLKPHLGLVDDQLPLHQRIHKKDECYKTRGIHGVYVFIVLLIGVWFLLLLFNRRMLNYV